MDLEMYAFPVSFAQQRLWFLDQLEPGSNAYNVPTVVRLTGRFDVQALQNSIDRIVERHETLRTTFVAVDGEPMQVVHEEATLPLRLLDLRTHASDTVEVELEHEIKAETRRPFDLEKGPLLRATLLQVAADHAVLVLVMHHIISDAWSMGVLIQELAQLYTAQVKGQPLHLPELPIQYVDYSIWQQETLQGEVLDKQLDYWKHQLSGAPEMLALHTDHPRPAVQSYKGGRLFFELPQELVKQLKVVSEQENCTLFMTLMAAFQTLLYRYTGQSDILVGSPVANRSNVELEGLIGFFVNTLVFRADLSDRLSFRQFLQQVRENSLGAYQHRDLPFERLIEELQPERSTSYHPLFQCMFVLLNSPTAQLDLGDLRMEVLDSNDGTAKFDLLLTVIELEGLRASFEYNVDLFERSTIERMIEHFQTLLAGLVQDVDQPINALPMLTAEERQQLLVEWNRLPEEEQITATLPALFEHRVAKSPDAVAVVCDGAALTYRELNEQANQLAHALQARGVGRGTYVGLAMERSISLIVGVLGIVKAGGAYVPLDPTAPKDRLAFTMEDAAIQCLVTESHLLDELPACNCHVFCFDRDANELSTYPSENLAESVEPFDPAYVIYTSGSTGKPKGVIVAHQNVVRLFSSTEQWYGFDEQDVWTMFHSFAFDFSVWEIWGALLYGGRLVVVPYLISRSPEAFYQLLVEQKVTVLNQTPSAFYQLMRAEEDLEADPNALSLHYVIFGGEALEYQSLQGWFDRHGDQTPQLVNMYGITETTVHVTYRPVSRADLNSGSRSSIGVPIPDLEVYVLNEALQPMPIGVPGEMYVGGAGVAIGYLNRPELTAERFIPHPFRTEQGLRLYKTGDLACYRADGTLDYLGRIDHQVKIRGFRIELGEIESLLAEQPGVRQAHVIVREDVPGDKRITAYVVFENDNEASVEELRHALRDNLPDYMIPSAFVTMESLPLTVNGKVDRKALPVPDLAQGKRGIYVAPQTPEEETLAAIWSDVLRVEQVGVQDNFFDLGGHSLLATKVMSRIQDAFDVKLPLRHLFEAPTVAALAVQILKLRGESTEAAEQPIQSIPREGKLPLSFTQQRMWVIDQMEPGSSVYNMPFAVRLQGALNVAALEKSLNDIIARHEVLRTTFAESAGEPYQVIAAQAERPLPVIDLTAWEPAEREAEAMRQIEADVLAPFDLAKGPVIRCFLLKMAETEHILFLNMHHIVSDGWSISVFVQELGELYESNDRGIASTLAELPIQYADYAHWQREWLQGARMEKQLSYWKQQLGGELPALQLPTDRPRPRVQTYRGATKEFALTKAMSDALQTFSQQQGSTLYMTLLSAFETLLYRYTGQEDLLVGTPIAGRNRSEVEALIGAFLNTLVVRVDLSGQPSFQELLGRVRHVTLDAFAHQDVPFEKLVEELQPERDLSRSPLFQVMFTLQNTPSTDLALSNVSLQAVEFASNMAKYDLTLTLFEGEDGLVGNVNYNVDLFDEATMDRLIGHYEMLLGAILRDPEQSIADLPMLTAVERKQLLIEWTDTETQQPRQAATIHQLFETQVEKTPDAVALFYQDERYTYQELNELANRMAHHLKRYGVAPGVLVGLFMERTPALVIGVLAILKAGGAYVPLDPSYPADRIAYVLEDAKAAVLLTEHALVGELPTLSSTVLCLEHEFAQIATNSADNLAPIAAQNDLAYVIYTSGSTGRPKGVAIEHRSVLALIHWADQLYTQEELAGVLFSTSLSFDLSVYELYVTLSRGGALVMAENALQLPQLPAKDQVTLINTVPSAIAELLRTERIPASVTTVNLCGEPLPNASVQKLYQLPSIERVYNLYGPTEDTVYSTVELTKQGERMEPAIGRPLPGSRAYVLDPKQQPVPIGVPGELYLGGAGLARGYLNRAELTAERFVQDPFCAESNARLYRTGDLVRYLPDGRLEFLGRIDQQVKVRGYRIELGEIESVLRTQPDVKQTVVVVREDQPGDKRITAYVVLETSATSTMNDLRAALQSVLPDYMIPSTFMELTALPLTPNGKVDRKALPVPDATQLVENEYVAPQTPQEETLAAIWADVLRVDRVGILDHFFDLGGHSLLATQVVSRIQEAFQVKLPLRSLFEMPTVTQLAAQIAALQQADQGEVAEPIQPIARNGLLPVSFTQQRLWVLQQMEPDSIAYNMPHVVRLRGQLEVQALEESLNDLLARHETLRTTLHETDGMPHQQIAAPVWNALPSVDVSTLAVALREAEATRLIEQEVQTPFDLAVGPLIRFFLIRVAADQHLFVLNLHHIIGDGWSISVLIQELGALYESKRRGLPAPLVELPIQYVDYAHWQNQYLQGETIDAQVSYWKQQLGGDLPALQLPTDRPHPRVQTFGGATQTFELTNALTEELRVLSQRQGATLFMTLLAAYQTLLHRYTGQDDIAVGTPIAGRNRKEVEGLIGAFINTLVIRTDLSGQPTFRGLLEQVRTVTLDAYAHQDVPFERLVEELQPERDLSRPPLFQVMFTMQNMPTSSTELTDLVLETVEFDNNMAKYELTLTCFEDEGRVLCSLNYNTDLFDASTIERMIEHFQTLLTGLVQDVDQPINALPMLTAEERQQLIVEWNRLPEAEQITATLPALFEEQAAKSPDAVAVVCDGAALTYRELNEQANQLAHALQARGVGRGTFVGLAMERSISLIIGVLGIVKAGGAYVPLDPTAPKDRLAFTMEDAAIQCLITESHLLDELPTCNCHVFCFDRDANELSTYPSENLAENVDPFDPAYVIYTSGSTGKPKGVIVAHQNVVRLFSSTEQWYGFDEQDVWTMFHSFAFDFSVWEIWGALLYGGRLVVVPYLISRSPEAFYQLLVEQKVTVLNQTPSAFYQLMRAEEDLEADPNALSLRYVIFGGEALEYQSLQGWFDRHGDQTPQLVNMYGITETTVHVTYRPVSRADLNSGSRSSIGVPIPDLEVYVLNEALQPMPIGVPGEMYVGGAGVAIGYLNRPELTEERFIPHPFRTEQGLRLYKTGDLACYRADGTLDYFGRIDHQVKIRGFRIELGEIESLLAEQLGVRQAHVIVREDVLGDKRITAYVVFENDNEASVEELHHALRDNLPDYMIPSAFVTMEALPLTVNGKVDRKALPVPDLAQGKRGIYVAPQTPEEETLAAIWSDVLRVEQIGVQDNFFDLGGHSLLATKVMSRIQDAFDVKLPLRHLFEAPTVAALAVHIAERHGEATTKEQPIQPIPREGILPVSFTQQRMWVLDQMEPGSAVYNMPYAVRLQGELNVTALEQSVNDLLVRHEVLRTTFAETDGTPHQVIALPIWRPLPIVDLTAFEPAQRETEAMRLMEADVQAPFDLANGPVIRFSLLQVEETEHILVLNMHHIVSDGWSISLFVQELGSLYESNRQGIASTLEELPIQYADYAYWQNQWMHGEMMETEMAYWKQQLGGELPVLQLPTDRPHPRVQTFRGATQTFELSNTLTKSLRTLSQRQGTTLFMTLLAAFQTLLHRYTGQEDIVIGTPIAGRNRKEVERLIGAFINTLVLRTDVSGEPTFLGLLERVRTVTLDAYAHQEMPFERLVEELQPERDLSRSPLFQVMFSMQNMPTSTIELTNVLLESLDVENEMAKFELTLTCFENDDRLLCSFNYNVDLFDASTIERMIGHFGTLLEAAVAEPQQAISRLKMLTEAERTHLLIDWNQTDAEYPSDACLHQIFEAQALRTPEAIAVVYGEQQMSYSELNRRANQLAHRLVRAGVGTDVLVGICMERSVEMIVAVFGILKAGGAYVPLDATYPKDRLAFLLHDSQTPVMLTQKRLLDKLPTQQEGAGQVELICLEPDLLVLDGELETPPQVASTPDQLAYVIYTSGTTGQPKGALLPHRGVVNLMTDFNNRKRVVPGAGCAAWSNFGFDLSVMELFGALLFGGRLHLLPDEMRADSVGYFAWLTAGDIHYAYMPPFFLKDLIDQLRKEAGEGKLQLQRIMVGVEPIHETLLAEIFDLMPEVTIINAYGPTEASICTTLYTVDPARVQERHTPIGTPVQNTKVYLLDAHLQPVPIGVPGELHTGGVHVGRGYLNRADLTAEKFIPSPFVAGNRLYKTGDMARYLPDGNIEYIARRDNQVKLRGFRIELGEIEAVLIQHQDVRETAVLVQELGHAKTLVAYVVIHESQSLDSGAMRQFLKDKLPDYMVPSAYVWLDALPLTPNGKIDRRALPLPDSSLMQRTEYIAPRTQAEEMLANIFAEVLGVSPVGVHDHFFELGGHSLLATRVMSRIQDMFGVKLPLRSLFESPTIALLVEQITSRQEDAASQVEQPIPRTAREGLLPVSFTQQRMWVLEQMEPGSIAYNMPQVLHLHGQLDVRALEASLSDLQLRHEVLRTTLQEVDGKPHQRIAEPTWNALSVIDLTTWSDESREAEAARVIEREVRTPFELAVGPLIRYFLIQMDELHHIFVLNMHHIIGDGWSMSVLIRELGSLYESKRLGLPSPLAELPIQYADFAHWQNQWLQGEMMEMQLSYWKQQLGGELPVLQLPTDYPRPRLQTFRGATEAFELSKLLTDELHMLSRRHGATLFMTLLAAFQTLLYRYSGQDDITIGTPIAGRQRSELEGLMGALINTLVMRTDLSGQPTFAELLARVRTVTLDAYAHQDLPFERLVEEVQPERDLSRSPLFQVMLVLQNTPPLEIELPGLTLKGVDFEFNMSKFEITLIFTETANGLHASLNYNTDLFHKNTIERMIANFQTLLNAIVANANQRIDHVSLLTDTEREQLLLASAGPVTSWNKVCLHDWFTRQVTQTPDAVAVVFAGQQLTYRELNAQANRLAHGLQRRGVQSQQVVGLYMERSIEMIVGLLGILKAGAAYLPLDPNYPQERLHLIIEDSQMQTLLTKEPLAHDLPTDQALVLSLAELQPELANERDTDPTVGASPDDVAYILYTSGSTGKPKGVMMEHHAISNLIAWQIETSSVTTGRTLQFASINFDVSVQEIFSTFGAGGTLVLISEDVRRDQAQLLHVLAEQRVERMFLPFVALQQLAEAANEPDAPQTMLREIMSAGEQLVITTSVINWLQSMPGCVLNNQYGPTETHVATEYALQGDPATWPTLPPVGKPIANVETYILDAQMEPVPYGVPGELYIGGAGVARGYLNRAEQTQERFLANPFVERTADTAAVFYKTGDLVRRLADGQIEYLGRLDQQVKIRGYRVELGEIEMRLSQHPHVREALVEVREFGAGNKRLVAYLVTEDAVVIDSHELQQQLRAQLPDYMIPSAFVPIEALPLTPSGKVDRKALPVPEKVQGLQNEYVAPQTDDERELVSIWSDVLQVETISIHDNFFDLGGHSLLGTQVISRIQKALSVKLPLRTLFENPTVSQLAAHIAQARDEHEITVEVSIEPVSRDKQLPLSFTQQRMWLIDRLMPQSIAYNMPYTMRLHGRLNVCALEQSLHDLLTRHEVLRTTFAETAGEPHQVIAPLVYQPIELIDLGNLSPAEREVVWKTKIEQDQKTPFDLQKGPLLRYFLIRLAEDEHLFHVNMHHIISDGWSMQVFVQELAALYESHSQQVPSPLPDLPIQYADFAHWQRETLQGEKLEQQLSYWMQQLGGELPLLQLPTDYPRPRVRSQVGAAQAFRLSKSMTESLQALSHQHGSTLFMTLLAAFQTLLYRYSGQEDILVGTPIAGRNRREIEGLIGAFINTLVLRSDLSGSPRFHELLQRVRSMTLDAYAHQDVPFEKLVEELQPERDMSRSPLFQVLFVLQNTPVREFELSDVRLEMFDSGREISKFDLTLTVNETEEGLAAVFTYSTELFAPQTIERMIGHFQTLLDQIVANPAQPIDTLRLLPVSEQAQLLVGWNDPVGQTRLTTVDWSEQATVQEVFAQHVAQTPDAIAVVFAEQSLTYRELDEQANRLAGRLQQQGVTAEALVGLYVERSLEMVVGLLAIVKAGGAYVPIDPKSPAERLTYIVEDTAMSVVLTMKHLADRLPEREMCVICLDDASESMIEFDPEMVSKTSRSDSLAYVLYTSGSTGRPKGVLIEHRQLIHYAKGIIERFGMQAGDRFALVSSVAVDSTNTVLFGSLLSGGTLHVLSEDHSLDAVALAAYFDQHQIDWLKIAPTHLSALHRVVGAEALMPRKGLVLGGEGSRWKWLQELKAAAPTCMIHNHYGPTETTVGVLTYRVEAEGVSEGTSRFTITPVGRPLPNTHAYIVDANLQPVPVGVIGELLIGGMSVARGYLNLPDVTAEKFIANPFVTEPNARVYRTGDLARYLPDGNIEFIGRADDQVKIRGFRIELGEVQAVLAQHPSVQEAIVVAPKNQEEEAQLVGYFVRALEGEPVSLQELRAFLSERLPSHMVPSQLIELEEIPRLAQGKVDRKALPKPDQVEQVRDTQYVAPRDALEQQLVLLWEKLLGTYPIGIHDNFFTLGGHSIMAVRLMAEIKQELGKDLPLATVFQAGTIAEIAALLREEHTAKTPLPLVPLSTNGTQTPLYLVHAIGGTVFSYTMLAKMLGDRPIYGLQAVGIEVGEEPLSSLEEMAAYYVQSMRAKQPHGPYWIGGWSFGGMIAYEMANQLQRMGEEVAGVLLLDTHLPYSAYDLEREQSEQELRLQFVIDLAGTLGVDQAAFEVPPLEGEAEELFDWVLQQIRQIDLLPSSFTSEDLQRLYNVYRANRAAYDAYCTPVFSGRVLLIRSQAGMHTALQATYTDWEHYVDDLHVQVVPGDHYTMLQLPQVQAISTLFEEEFQRCLMNKKHIVLKRS